LIDLPCQSKEISLKLIHTIRGALDFLYLARYSCHSDKTLELLDDALQRFHADKDVLIDLGIQDHFRIMKIHFFDHYHSLIELFGTADGYDTEYTEQLHIDFTKDAYRATNHKDEYWQMVYWLERKEKIQCHAKFLNWRTNDKKDLQLPEKSNRQNLHGQLKMTKHPSLKSVPIEVLINDYGAKHFREAFARYIVTVLYNNITPAQLEQKAQDIFLPTRHLPVYHRIKFVDPVNQETIDSVHVKPKGKTKRNQETKARFDTVLVNNGKGEKVGIKSKY
jgi:hypothetical protein